MKVQRELERKDEEEAERLAEVARKPKFLPLLYYSRAFE